MQFLIYKVSNIAVFIWRYHDSEAVIPILDLGLKFVSSRHIIKMPTVAALLMSKEKNSQFYDLFKLSLSHEIPLH